MASDDYYKPFDQLTNSELDRLGDKLFRAAMRFRGVRGSGCPGMEGDEYREMMSLVNLLKDIEEDRGINPDWS